MNRSASPAESTMPSEGSSLFEHGDNPDSFQDLTLPAGAALEISSVCYTTFNDGAGLDRPGGADILPPIERTDDDRANPLANVEPIELPQGQLVRRIEDLNEIIEPAALPACQELFDKNILTVSASANRKDAKTAYVDIDFATLSEENQRHALAIGEPIAPTPDTRMPAVVKLAVAIESGDTEADIALKLSALAGHFDVQPLLWAPQYTIDELKTQYGYGAEESVAPNDFVAEGYYYDEATQRFHLSAELYEKSQAVVLAQKSKNKF